MDTSTPAGHLRGLDPTILEQYGIRSCVDGTVFQYRDDQGRVVGQKVRDKDKKISWRGSAKEVVGFGAHLASPERHEAVAITEGEFDAPSIYQATGGKVPGVSVPNGAQNAAAFVRKHLDWFLRFKVVYIATDMDDPGQEAATQLAELFPAGQVKRIQFPKKDANDVLQELGSVALRDAVYSARDLRPDGIRSASEYAGLALKPTARASQPYSFRFWNDMTPLWSNQLVILVAGSGVGKTSIARSLAIGAMESGARVGWIGLEETVDEAIYRFVGMAAGVQIHARTGTQWEELTDEERERMEMADRFICRSGRLELFDHFGSLDEATILRRMNYMVRSLGCRLLFLDHLTIMGSGLGQETRQIDATVTKLRSFIAGTGCTVVAINHLSRGDKSRNFEDGGVPELHDIRGSHSIVQLADTIWAMGRRRGENLTHTFCLKNRMLGRLGYAGSLSFDEATQQFQEQWLDPSCPF